MEEFRTKTFRSGNSVALRLPKSLGFREGERVVAVPHANGSVSFWRESAAATVLDGLYGAFSSKFMADGRGDIEQEDRDWSKPPHDRAA